jgi:hypothetical protein
MAHQTYQVVFRGQIVPGATVDDVKANLAKLFNTDAAKVESLFSGRSMVLKKGLEREAGERYRALLEKAGARCELVPAPGPNLAPSMPPASTKPAGPASVDDREAGTAPPELTQGAAVLKAKAKAVRAGDIHQALGALRDRVQDMDAQEAGKRVTSFIGGAGTAMRAALQRARRADRKMIFGVLAAACGLAVVLFVMLGGTPEPMPIERAVFDRFAKQYYREIRKSDLANLSANVLIQRAREVVEDMGYDFDRTLLFWMFHQDRVESEGGRNIYNTILVDPVAVAVAAGLSGIDDTITPETRKVFETAAGIPPGVDLISIRMLKSCPSEGSLFKHDDLLQVLADNGMTTDSGAPDLAIADAFFGLERAGFIKIQRRWENDVQFSDIELLEPEAMQRVEDNLQYLDEMKKKFSAE